MGGSKKRIFLADLLSGLEKDKVYRDDCHILLERYAGRLHLEIEASDTVSKCLKGLLAIWVVHEHLPLYHHALKNPIELNADASIDIFTGHYDHVFQVEKGDLERFLHNSVLPLPAPKTKEQDSFWYHGNRFSTESNNLKRIAQIHAPGIKKRQDKHSRTIARMAVDKMLKNFSDPFRVYPRELDYHLSALSPSINRIAAIEWYRYRAIEESITKLSGSSNFSLNRKRILHEELQAIIDWGECKIETPTKGNMEVLKDFPTCLLGASKRKTKDEKAPENLGYISNKENYFICRGDNWRVRFDGGKECDIKTSKPIRTIVEYLLHRDESLDRADLYFSLHGNITDSKDIDKKEVLMQSPKVKGDRPTLDVNEIIDPEMKKKLEKMARDLAKNIDNKLRQGVEDKKLLEDFETLKESLRKKYNACLIDDGSIRWGPLTYKDQYRRAGEMTQKHIKRGIESIRQKKSLNGLADHLEKFLKKNRDCYRPPPSFPDWDIKI